MQTIYILPKVLASAYCAFNFEKFVKKFDLLNEFRKVKKERTFYPFLLCEIFYLDY